MKPERNIDLHSRIADRDMLKCCKLLIYNYIRQQVDTVMLERYVFHVKT